MTNASEVLSSIQSAFPGAVLDSRVESDRRLWATIDSNKIVDVCKHLTTKLNFDHYSGAAGVDWIARKEMEVVEIMASHGAHQVVAMLKVKTPRDNSIRQIPHRSLLECQLVRARDLGDVRHQLRGPSRAVSLAPIG